MIKNPGTPTPKKQFSHSCSVCNDSGWVCVVHRENHNHYTFRCPCPASTQKGYSQFIPVWRGAREEKFELLSKYNDRGGWKEIKKQPGASA